MKIPAKFDHWPDDLNEVIGRYVAVTWKTVYRQTPDSIDVCIVTGLNTEKTMLHLVYPHLKSSKTSSYLNTCFLLTKEQEEEFKNEKNDCVD